VHQRIGPRQGEQAQRAGDVIATAEWDDTKLARGAHQRRQHAVDGAIATNQHNAGVGRCVLNQRMCFRDGARDHEARPRMIGADAGTDGFFQLRGTATAGEGIEHDKGGTHGGPEYRQCGHGFRSTLDKPVAGFRNMAGILVFDPDGGGR